MTNSPPTQTLSLEQTWQAFFTPPKAAPNGRSKRILASGDTFTVPFNESSLVATTWGDGPTVLLVHGWGAHRGQLAAFVEPLIKGGFRALAFDGPAHGDSPGEQTNLYQSREALLNIAERYGPLHAVLAHSFGTLVNTMALDAGMHVEKVVHFGALQSGKHATDRFHYMMQTPKEVQILFKEKMESTFGPRVWKDVSAAFIAPKLEIPALFVHDENDEITPFADSEAIIAAWPGARLLKTNGLSHRGVLHDLEVIRTTISFLRA